MRPRTAGAAQKQATSAEPGTNGSSSSIRDPLRSLYASVLKCRLTEERAQSASLTGRYDFAIGEEAVAAGAAADLGVGDTLTASPRDLTALVAGGMDVEELLRAEETRSSKGSWSGAPGLAAAPGLNGSSRAGLLSLSSLSEDPFTLATGIALAHKLARKQHVVVAIAGQAGSLEPWRESFRISGSQKLPVVYVMRNGGANELEHAPHLKPVSFMAREGGFPGIVVDGQDVVAVRRVVQESIHRARNRGGPTLIDCRTERGRDPLAHLEHYMRKRGVWDDGWRRKLEMGMRAEM